jgi:hypothetical protein
LVVGVVAAGGPAAIAAPVQGTADRDTKEVQSYRLSMPVIQKMSAVYKAAAAEAAKDPKKQQLAKKKAELKALEAKDEPTDAEQQRMSVLADEIERMEDGDDAGTSADSSMSLSQMAARIDAVPSLAAAVRAAGMTSREFATAQLTLLQTGIAHALLKASPAGTAPPPGVLKENLEFFRLHEKELESIFASLDKGSADR